MVALVLGHGENLWWQLGLVSVVVGTVGLTILVVLVRALQRPMRPGGGSVIRRVLLVLGIVTAMGAAGYAFAMFATILYPGMDR